MMLCFSVGWLAVVPGLPQPAPECTGERKASEPTISPPSCLLIRRRLGSGLAIALGSGFAIALSGSLAIAPGSRLAIAFRFGLGRVSVGSIFRGQVPAPAVVVHVPARSLEFQSGRGNELFQLAATVLMHGQGIVGELLHHL